MTRARSLRRDISLDEALAGYQLALKRLQLTETTRQSALDMTRISALEEVHLQGLVRLRTLKERLDAG